MIIPSFALTCIVVVRVCSATFVPSHVVSTQTTIAVTSQSTPYTPIVGYSASSEFGDLVLQNDQVEVDTNQHYHVTGVFNWSSLTGLLSSYSLARFNGSYYAVSGNAGSAFTQSFYTDQTTNLSLQCFQTSGVTTALSSTFSIYELPSPSNYCYLKGNANATSSGIGVPFSYWTSQTCAGWSASDAGSGRVAIGTLSGFYMATWTMALTNNYMLLEVRTSATRSLFCQTSSAVTMSCSLRLIFSQSGSAEVWFQTAGPIIGDPFAGTFSIVSLTQPAIYLVAQYGSGLVVGNSFISISNPSGILSGEQGSVFSYNSPTGRTTVNRACFVSVFFNVYLFYDTVPTSSYIYISLNDVEQYSLTPIDEIQLAYSITANLYMNANDYFVVYVRSNSTTSFTIIQVQMNALVISDLPTDSPTRSPSRTPSLSPFTSAPSGSPSAAPTRQPIPSCVPPRPKNG